MAGKITDEITNLIKFSQNMISVEHLHLIPSTIFSEQQKVSLVKLVSGASICVVKKTTTKRETFDVAGWSESRINFVLNNPFRFCLACYLQAIGKQRCTIKFIYRYKYNFSRAL